MTLPREEHVKHIGDRLNELAAVVFVIEFKVGEKHFPRSDLDQGWCKAYRVLLTRARQGMVIFVPPGEPNDPTRPPAFYDSMFRHLSGLGIPVLDH